MDAGSGVGVQLIQAGVRAYDWPPVFITHHHSDHVIDLGHLLITRWIVGQNAPFEVYGPAGTRRQMDLLLDYLAWDIDIRRAHMHDRRPPEVRVTEIEEGRVLETGGVTVSAFVVEHDPVRPAFGYRFEGGGRSVVVSGDTKPCENLMKWSRGVDVLIHECCEMTKTGWFPGCGWPTLEEKIRDLQSYHTPPAARPRGCRRPGPPPGGQSPHARLRARGAPRRRRPRLRGARRHRRGPAGSLGRARPAAQGLMST